MKRIFLFLYLLSILMSSGSCNPFNRDKEKTDMTDKGDIYKILHYASLAGSSHNSQPWKTEVYGEDSILVYADSSRILSVVDKTGRELYISIGAFVENLSIAADCFGYQTAIHLSDFEGHPAEPVASVQLFKSDLKMDDFNLTDIEQRTTLRIPFDTIPVQKPDWEKLVCLDTSAIHFISSATAEGKFIAKNELEAYAIQSRNEQAKDELAKWIRFSNKDVNEKRDGLTPAGMGITGIGGFFVRNFFKPEDSKKETFVAQGIEKTKKQTENCGGWIIITQENDNLAACVNVGRLYERINLSCRKLNLGFHPMNQIIEEDAFENKLNSELNLKGRILFVARIGYVNEYPAPVSPRRSVGSFTMFK